MTSGDGRACRLLVGFVCQNPVPYIVSIFLALQATEQGSKLCLVYQSMMQCNGNIHLVKGVLYCAHQCASLHITGKYYAPEPQANTAIECTGVQACHSGCASASARQGFLDMIVFVQGQSAGLVQNCTAWSVQTCKLVKKQNCAAVDILAALSAGMVCSSCSRSCSNSVSDIAFACRSHNLSQLLR